jgi:branched-chain amino acid transport system substrate-binding protein
VKKFGKEPDRWASGHCWAGLEIMQQAVASSRPGPQGAARVIAKNEFKTILGPIRFDHAARTPRFPAP